MPERQIPKMAGGGSVRSAVRGLGAYASIMPEAEQAASTARAAARVERLGESGVEVGHMAHDVGDTMGLTPAHGVLPEPEPPEASVSGDAEMRPLPGYVADALARTGYAEHVDPQTGALHRYRALPEYADTPELVHQFEAAGRGIMPGFDYPVAAAHWAADKIRAALGDYRYEDIPFQQVLDDVRREHDRAAEENPEAEAAGSVALTRAFPWSEARGLVGAGLRTAQAAGLDIAHAAGRGVDPTAATREALSDAPTTAGLDLAAPWVGHLLEHTVPSPAASTRIRRVLTPAAR
ncbi:MAG TPA: hypothetical protein VF841_18570 [Anaeromyxobacter sp.]